jgi:hypothetical protein
MAKIKCTCTKKTPGMKAAPPLPKGAAPSQLNIQDNGDNTFTMQGYDQAGNLADISAVADLTSASSSDVAVITVDAPSGVNSAMHVPVPAPKVGATASLALTTTWKDGSVGPFAVDWPIKIEASPVSGVVPVPGIPTTH